MIGSADGETSFSIDQLGASIRQKARSDGTNMKWFYYKRIVRGFQAPSEGGPGVRGRATTPGADLPNLCGNKALRLFEDIAEQHHLSLTA